MNRKAVIAFLFMFFVLPFSVLAQQRLASMCDTTFTVSGDVTIIDIENIRVPKPGKTIGEVIVTEKELEANNTGIAGRIAAIIDVKEFATYELYARILYSDNTVQAQFNESFFIQICEFSPDIPCIGSSGLDLSNSCVLPCNPNAGANRVVVEDVNVGLDITRKAGTFVLEKGIYSIWLNHFSLIADKFRKFLNADANGRTCGPNVNIDECFNVDSVHLLGLELRKVAAKKPDLLVEKVVDKPAAQPGDTLTYSVVMTNVGSDIVYNVKLTDDISDFGNKVKFNQINLTSPAGQFSSSQSFEPDSGRFFFGNRISVTSEALSFSPADTMNINLASGQAIQIEYEVTLKDTSFFSSFSDTLFNLAGATGSCEENISNNSASVMVVVTDTTEPPPPRNYDLEIEKTVSPGRVMPDSTFRYVVTVTNNGPGFATKILVGDIVPDSVSIDSLSLLRPFTSSGDSLFWNIDSLAAGASEVIRFNGFVPGSLNLPLNQEFLFTNTSFVSALRDTFLINNRDSATVFVKDSTTNPPSSSNYDLEIKKSVSEDSVGVDSIFVYSIRITNNGPGNATEILVSDIVPDSVSIDLSSLVRPFSGRGDSLFWNIDSLSVDSTEVIHFNGFVSGSLNLPADQYFSFTNRSFVSAPRDTFLTNNRDSARVIVKDSTSNPPPSSNYDLEIKKSVSSDSTGVDSVFVYSIRITNNGPGNATEILVSDIVPDSVSIDLSSLVRPFSGRGDSLFWNIDSLSVDSTEVIRFNGFVSGSLNLPVGQYFSFTNRSFVSAPHDTFLVNNRDSATVFVAISDTTEPSQNDLELFKNVAPDTVQQGQSFEYSLKVINKGGATARDIALWDIFSDSIQVDFNSFSLELFSNNRDTLMWKIDSLAAGDSALATFDASVPLNLQLPEGECTPFRNTATVYAVDDSDRSNNTSGAVVCVNPPIDTCNYDLQLTKTVNRDTVNQGESAQFRIDIINDNPCPVTNVTIVDAIPAGLIYSNFEPQPEDPFATDTLRWVIPVIDSGKVFTITYNALCPQNSEITVPKSFANSACLIDQNDSNASNNCDDATFICKPLTNCMADPSSFYLDRNIFEPGKLTRALPQDLVITINFSEPMSITLDVFDITGYKIKRIAEGLQMVGENSYTWDGRTENGGYAGSGVYLVFVRDVATGGRKLECFLKVIVVQ